MSETRRIRKVVTSRATIEGAGVHLHRAIGLGAPEEYDPFLLLDDFRSDEPAHAFRARSLGAQPSGCARRLE